MGPCLTAKRPLAAIVMAGGRGSRMHSDIPKHLHLLLGRRMVDWVIAAGRAAGAEPLVVVASPLSADAFAGQGVTVAVQARPRGTGDAVRAAKAALTDSADILVLSGDTPLLSPELLQDLVAHHRQEQAQVTVLSARPDDPRQYGRVVRGEDGAVLRIVEFADANAKELALDEVNTSIYVFQAARLWPVLERLEPKNGQGELYLTDTIELLAAQGAHVAAYIAPDSAETDGVNTPAELETAARRLLARDPSLEGLPSGVPAPKMSL